MQTAAQRVDCAPAKFRGFFIRWCRNHQKTVAFSVYAAVAIIANFPVFPGDPSRLSTSTTYDIAQTTWFLAYTPYALLHGHNLFYTNAVNYPYGVNLAQNTGMPLLGLLTAPLTLLVSPIASLNLLRWLAFCLSAFSAFWVFRKLVRWQGAAFVGGLLYGFSPYMVTQGSLHLNLTFVPIPPLIFYVLYEVTHRQEQSPRRQGLLLGGLVIAQFFISAEVLATTGLVALIGTIYYVIATRRSVIARARQWSTSMAFASVLILPALAYPVWFMLHGPAHYTGPAQGFNNVFNADLLGPFVPTLAQLVAPRHLAEIGSNFVAGPSDLSENGTYLGIPLLVIATYILIRFRRIRWFPYLVLMAATMFVLSLGPQLVIDGKVRHLPISLPFRLINHLPFLENLLPVRFSLYVIFFLALLLTLGLEEIHKARVATGNTRLWIDRGHGGSTVGQVIAWTLGVVTVISLLPAFPYRSFASHVNWAESKSGLAIIPTGATVLTYPYATVFQDSPMLWQALSNMRFKIIGSYALVPSVNRQASLLPTPLKPLTVEAMLENSISPTPVPGVPDVLATASTLHAQSIQLVPRSLLFSKPKLARDEIHATIDSVNARNGTLVVWVKRRSPILVDTMASTTLTNARNLPVALIKLHAGEHVAIVGNMTSGTIGPSTVKLLRRFIVVHHVDDVIVGLGLRDSAEIAHWFRLALGSPTRAGAGGEIWLHANARAA